MSNLARAASPFPLHEERALHGKMKEPEVNNMGCFDYEDVQCAICGHRTKDGYQIVDGKVLCDECSNASQGQDGGALRRDPGRRR
jgi:hypothetical protein